MIIPSYEDILKRNHYNKNFLKKNYPEFCQYIIDRYRDSSLSWTESLYWYYNNLTDIPKCKVCGNNVKFKNIVVGYCDYCSHKCCTIGTRDKAKNTCLEKYGTKTIYNNPEKRRKTSLERYGVDCYTKSKEYIEKSKRTYLERYGVDNYTRTDEYKHKRRKTSLERYGVEDYSSCEEVKKKIKDTKIKNFGSPNYNNIEKQRQTCLERFGVDSYSKTQEYKEKYKETSLERFGVENYTKTKEYKEKEYQTKKKNHTFNSSKIEKQIEQYLIENNIEYKTQYKSIEYPFNCDFYIPTVNLYIELNIHWTHGDHPYNPNDIDDQKQLEYWKSKNTKFYDNAITTWTIRDVEKRKIAKNNKLNFIEFFTNDKSKIIDRILYFINTK